MYNFYFIKSLLTEWLKEQTFLNPLYKPMNNSPKIAIIQIILGFPAKLSNINAPVQGELTITTLNRGPENA